jgi:hypothetical protein
MKKLRDLEKANSYPIFIFYDLIDNQTLLVPKFCIFFSSSFKKENLKSFEGGETGF